MRTFALTMTAAALLAGCQPQARTIDITPARLAATAAASPAADLSNAPSAEYAPAHFAAFAWDDTGLHGRLSGRTASFEETTSVSIRSQGGPVVYLEIPLMILQWDELGKKAPSLHVTVLRKDGTEEVRRLSADEMKWSSGGPSQFANAYSGGFLLTWKALGYAAPPKDLIVVVRQIVRREPGAIFTLQATQPASAPAK